MSESLPELTVTTAAAVLAALRATDDLIGKQGCSVDLLGQRCTLVNALYLLAEGEAARNTAMLAPGTPGLLNEEG